MKNLILKTILSFNFLAVVLLGISHYSSFAMVDSDFWSRIACGSMILNKGWVIYQDYFTFVSTKSFWVDHEWLSGIIFFLIFKHFSDLGILITKLILLFMCFVPVLLTANLRYQSKKNILFYGLILLAMFPAFGSNIRPHDFTYVFFATWLFVLEYSRLKDSTKYLYMLPISIILWANLHAGCLAGIALLSVYSFGQYINKKTFKPYIICLLFSLLAMMVNPYGYHYYIYIFNELSASHSSIAEWAAVDLMKITDFICFKILVIITLTGLIFSKLPKKDSVAIILLVSLCIIGFKVGRHNILFVIVAGVFAYEHVHNLTMMLLNILKEKISARAHKNLLFIIQYVPAWLIFILSINYLLSQNLLEWKLKVPLSSYPVNSVELMKVNSIKANLLLPFGWGGYTTWLLYPNIKVSADGRFVEIFDLQTFELTNNFYYAKTNWDEILKKYPVNAILIDKSSPMFQKINNINNFSIVFSDKYSVLLLKNDLNHKKIIIPKYLNNNFIPNLSDSYFMRLI